jgi:UDP-glucose 4-epimerase|tara:strand:- start:570 stop:1475 length:906 start_codon:yes stop_codon:yes gene_type:complete
LKKKIVIVGGTGFIGYHLAKHCIKMKWVVYSVSSKYPTEKNFVKKVKYIICDITNKKLLKKKIDFKFDYAVNLGGYVNHKDKRKTFKTHFNGCKNIAEILKKKDIKLFVQIGSSLEYGKLKSPHLEKSNCVPISNYAKAKYASTKFLLDLYAKYSFPTTVLRLYQVYGPGQDFNRFIPLIIKGCLSNKKFPCSNGDQYRDFIYIDDVVEAIIKILKSNSVNGKILNIGSGKCTQIKKIIKKIQTFVKQGLPQFGKIKLRKEENYKTFPSIKKAKILLNWKPKISFDEGLLKTIKYYEKKIK